MCLLNNGGNVGRNAIPTTPAPAQMRLDGCMPPGVRNAEEGGIMPTLFLSPWHRLSGVCRQAGGLPLRHHSTLRRPWIVLWGY